jgi:hypothetical protein
MTQELFQEWMLLNLLRNRLTDNELKRLYELEDRTPIKPLIIDSKIAEYYLPF